MAKAAQIVERDKATYLFSDVITEKKPIYVYNVGPIEHNITNPPNIPRFLVKRCPDDQEYILVGEFEHPFDEIREDTEGNKFTVPINGYTVVAKMLSPQNPGSDQDWREAEPQFFKGSNYNEYGVFWSVNNPPTKKEVQDAKKRLELTFTKELKFLAEEERKNPQHFQDLVNNISHLAADYFHEQTTWHKTDYKKIATYDTMDCPECGETIKKIAKKCRFCDFRFDINEQVSDSSDPAMADKMARMREARRQKKLAEV